MKLLSSSIDIDGAKAMWFDSNTRIEMVDNKRMMKVRQRQAMRDLVECSLSVASEVTIVMRLT